MAPNWPSLSFVGNVGRSANTKNDLFDQNTTNWSIGLQLNIPLFTGLSSVFQRNSLASQEKQLEYTETKTSDTVSLNQIQTEKNLESAQTALDASREAAIYGRQSKTAAERDYRLLNINYLQYQTSLQAYLTAETGYNQAKYNYIVAVAQYFNAAGVPISILISKLEELSALPATE
jgi:outer membrane protein TolC